MILWPCSIWGPAVSVHFLLPFWNPGLGLHITEDSGYRISAVPLPGGPSPGLTGTLRLRKCWIRHTTCPLQQRASLGRLILLLRLPPSLGYSNVSWGNAGTTYGSRFQALAPYFYLIRPWLHTYTRTFTNLLLATVGILTCEGTGEDEDFCNFLQPLAHGHKVVWFAAADVCSPGAYDTAFRFGRTSVSSANHIGPVVFYR